MVDGGVGEVEDAPLELEGAGIGHLLHQEVQRIFGGRSVLGYGRAEPA
jgi:hypothetical protein